MNDNLAKAVDAFSASPALRLRYTILAAKTAGGRPPPVLPPRVGEPSGEMFAPSDAETVAFAVEDGHPLAKLMMLRAEAAAEVERLLTFLDTTEGIVEDEDGDEDCDVSGGNTDREEETSDDEPWLGAPEIPLTFNEYSEKYQMWFERQGDQTRWAAGTLDDGEGDAGEEAEEDRDREPDVDDEPWLGWPEAHSLGNGQIGVSDDREVELA